MAKDKFWDVYFMLPVNLYRDGFAVIKDSDHASFLIDVDIDLGHSVVPLEIVGGIDKYFIEYFV